MAAAGAVATGAAPATAAAPSGGTGSAGPAAGSHCVMRAATGATTCFDTEAEAVGFATGGRVDAEGLSGRALDRAITRANGEVEQERASGRASQLADGEVIGARVFEDARYQGASFTITIGQPCVKDDMYEWSYELGEDWRNRVSSVQSWANCWIWLYDENEVEEGPYKEDNPDIGGFADRAWRVAGS